MRTLVDLELTLAPRSKSHFRLSIRQGSQQLPRALSPTNAPLHIIS